MNDETAYGAVFDIYGPHVQRIELFQVINIGKKMLTRKCR